MRRRTLLTAAVLLLPTAAAAQPARSSLAAWLEATGHALRKSGEAMALLSDRLIALAASDAMAAERPLAPERAETAADALISVYREFVELRTMQTTRTAPALQLFAENPDPEQWETIKARLISTQQAIRRVDEAIAGLDPDFTLTPLYPALRMNLGARSAALSRLAEAPAPETPEELAAYRGMVGEYLQLLARMETLGEAFRKYAAALQAAGGPR